MNERVWQYILENKVAGLLFIIAGLSIVASVILLSIRSAIKNWLDRKSCKHDDDCPRSAWHCDNCFDYEKKDKKEKK